LVDDQLVQLTQQLLLNIEVWDGGDVSQPSQAAQLHLDSNLSLLLQL